MSADVIPIRPRPFEDGLDAVHQLGLRPVPVKYRHESKHPAVDHWPQVAAEATTRDQREYLRRTFAEQNIGAAMGRYPNGVTYFVVDLDLGDLVGEDEFDDEGRRTRAAEWTDGAWQLDVFMANHGLELPPTLTWRTGSGGRQMLFWCGPEWRVPSRTRLYGAAIDIRGGDRDPSDEKTGFMSYVVVPPSVHFNGQAYEWLDVCEPAEAPEWLIEYVGGYRAGEAKPRPGKAGGGNGPTGRQLAESGDPIPEGGRNDALTRLAGFWRGQGLSPEAVYVELDKANRERCRPPLPDDEVRRIAESSAGFAPHTSPEEQMEAARLARALGGDPAEDAGRPGARPWTDIGNARRLVDRHGDRLRHAPRLGSWFVWDGARWAEDDRNEVLRLAQDTALSIFREQAPEDEEKRRRFAAHAVGSSSDARLRAMVHLATADPRVVVTPDQFDADPWLLNCPNGTLDLRTGELLPHDPDRLITRLCPTRFVPGVTDPVVEKAIGEALPDPAMRRYVLRFLGTCLTGDVSEKAILVLKGPHDTGKSTLAEGVRATLGDVSDGGYATSWEADVVQASSRVNRGEKLNKIRGARLVLVGELEKGSRMADGFVKELSGGDAMDARALYRGSYSFRPEAKLVMPTNHVPRSADRPLQSRLRLVPFEHRPRVADRSIKRHLDSDPGAHEAILAALVAACAEWRAEGTLGDTPWLSAELADYARDSDPVQDFVDDALMPCEPGDGAAVHIELAWRLYEAWATEFVNKGQQLRRREFERTMEMAGHEKRRIPAKGGLTRWATLAMRPVTDLPEACKNVVALHAMKRTET